MKKINLAFLLGLVLTVLSCSRAMVQEKSKPVLAPKNIILLIGDGMGLTQVSTSFYFNDRPSNFARFKCIGLQQTMPTSHKVTDSASAATALACGVKTYNGAIGVNSDTMPVASILEMVAEKGYRTGLVATSSIQHATPASFYAHTPFRSDYEEITRQLVHAPVHFFAGGGKKFFNQRQDRINYFDTLKAQKYRLDTTSLIIPEEFSVFDKYAYVLADDGLMKMQEGRGDFLPIATEAALKYLSLDEDGFFLMVEGSQIDWGGHANDAQYVIEEVKDFDKAIGVALNFAEKDGSTLVIVTADHETGGLSLSAATIYGQGEYNVITPTFSTGNHSATLIPVFAYGPGAEQFMGIYQNNDIFKKMLRLLHLRK